MLAASYAASIRKHRELDEKASALREELARVDGEVDVAASESRRIARELLEAAKGT